MMCFRNFLVAKKFRDMKGAVSKFSFETSLSHIAEKFRRGTLYSFISFSYRKKIKL